jgi:hypothetical protein
MKQSKTKTALQIITWIIGAIALGLLIYVILKNIGII